MPLTAINAGAKFIATGIIVLPPTGVTHRRIRHSKVAGHNFFLT
jgi:hypothetical protein